MTTSEKLIIKHLTEGHIPNDGGYPYDYEYIGDHLVVAGLIGDNETILYKYPALQIQEAVRTAIKWQKEGMSMEESILDAIEEVLS